MVEWKYKDYRPAGFECWEAVWDKNYSISVAKLSDAGTRHTVRLHYKDMTDVKEHIDAKDWDEAKAIAINTIRDYIERHANYWYCLRDSFDDWVEEG